MAHTAPPTPIRRRLELAFGVLLLLVGVSVAAIAVLALNHPASQQAAASVTRLPAGTQPASASPSGAPTSTNPASTSSASTGSAAGSAAAGSNGDPASVASSGRLPLIVLNNTSSTPGSVAADRFRQAGWTVTDISTFEGDILSTAAYYDPDVPGAASAATQLQQEFSAIHRVKPKFPGLPDGPVVVVLTSDYS